MKKFQLNILFIIETQTAKKEDELQIMEQRNRY